MASASTPLRQPVPPPDEPAEDTWADVTPEMRAELDKAFAETEEEDRLGLLEDPVQL